MIITQKNATRQEGNKEHTNFVRNFFLSFQVNFLFKKREQASRVGRSLKMTCQQAKYCAGSYEKCSGYAGDSEPAKENVCPVGKDDGRGQATRHHTAQQKNSQ